MMSGLTSLPSLQFDATSVNGLPEFVNKPDSKYDCCYCSKTLQPPVKQTSCGHRVCASCVEQLFSTGDTVMCPEKDEDCGTISKNQVSLTEVDAYVACATIYLVDVSSVHSPFSCWTFFLCRHVVELDSRRKN